MAKKNIDEVFLNLLNKCKEESKLNDEVYNFILNNYDIDKEYFTNNIIFKYNRELFYSIYINFKLTCNSFNYSDYCNKLDDMSLIYYDKLDEQFNTDVLYNMSNLLFVLEKKENNKESNKSKNILYSLKAIFNKRNNLSNTMEYIVTIEDIEKLTDYLLELRINMSEEEVYSIFCYVISNIDNKNFDLEEFITKVKQNNYIYLQDYEYFNNFEENHQNLFASVNSNMDLYKKLVQDLISLEDKYNTSFENIDSSLSSIVRKLKKDNK